MLSWSFDRGLKGDYVLVYLVSLCMLKEKVTELLVLKRSNITFLPGSISRSDRSRWSTTSMLPQ